MGVLVRAWVLGVAGLVVMAGAAKADPQFPPRKAGLWENTMTSANMMMNGQKMPGPGGPGGMVTFSCVDPASDLKLEKRMTAGEPGCAPPVFGGGGGHITFANSCARDGHTTNVTGAMTYVSDQHIVVDMQMSGTGMTGSMQMSSVWSGACPAGIVPGDYGMVMGGAFQKEGNVNNLP
jgi:hypothetical protein